MAKCNGTIDNHCCWLNGKECKYLRKYEDGTIACGLLIECGSWDAVYTSQRYLRNVKPILRKILGDETDCGQWPRPAEKCNSCNCIG